MIYEFKQIVFHEPLAKKLYIYTLFEF